MTAAYSDTRYQILREVALGNPKVAVTAPPVIDRLFAEGLLQQRGLRVVFTPEGLSTYKQWEMARTCGRLPGVQIQRARTVWRCAAHRQLTGHTVTIHHPGKPATTIGIEGAGGEEYIAQLRRENPNARIATVPIPNPYHVPGCTRDIPTGDQYAVWQGRRLHVRCALARIIPNTPPQEGTQ